MGTEHAPTQDQIRRDYLKESAGHTLVYGRLFAALTLPILAWYFYQDHALGFGAETMMWRGGAFVVSTLFLVASWTVLPSRASATIAAHALLIAGPVVNAAGLTVTLFILRPEDAGFQEGVRGALFITIFAAFAFAAGARRYVWAVVSLPVAGMAVALLMTDTLKISEWALFTDVAVVCLVVSIVSFRQEQIHLAEFKMRRWAQHRKSALEDRLQELRQLNRQLREFAYLVSHDLQEPLRTMSGFMGLARDGLAMETTDMEKVDEFLNQAQKGAVRMGNLMDGLLTYSRIETTAGSHQVVGLDAVLEEAEANLAGRIRETGARIQREPLPTVLGDQGQLVQLFQNLVANALKYHRPGATPEVIIRSEKGGDRGDQVTIMVADYGIGIAAEHHERIFRLFQRLHTRTEYEGTGVGLAVVRRIVERHDGKITVESAKDAGATFRVTLPRG